MGRRDLFRHAVRNLRADLAAVGPIDLVAVVVLRIVGGGDVDAGNRADLADQESQFGRRPEIRENKGRNAVLRQDHSGQFRELMGKMSGIVGDDDAFVLFSRRFFQNELRDAFRRPADRIVIHTHRARADLAAQTRCAEDHVRDKTFLKLFLIALKRQKFFMKRIAFGKRFQPDPVSLLIIHFVLLFQMKSGSRENGPAGPVSEDIIM